MNGWMDRLRAKEKDFIVDDMHLKRLMDIINKKIENKSVKMIFIKSFFGMLAPNKPTDNKVDIKKEKEFFKKLFDHFNYKDMDCINNEQELLKYCIDFHKDKLSDQTKLLDILSMLCLTHKGLLIEEILRVVPINEEDLYRIFNVFKVFLMSYQRFWVCNNEMLRQVVEVMNYSKKEEREKLHKKIAQMLDKTPNSVRKLEEQAYHLYSGGDYFALKQMISTVENFLLLFNPMNKFDLFRYWQCLENFGYDPVIEYNKGIELFDTHYSPEPDKLFMIILQVCRFLKEFSDFETEITPIFRHPQIKGKVGVKNQKKLKKGEEKLGKHGGSSFNSKAAKLRKKKDPLGLDDPFYNSENELSDVDDQNENSKLNQDGNTFNYLDVIGLLKELKNFNLTNDVNGGQLAIEPSNQTGNLMRYEQRNKFKRRFDEILEEWEDVNVEVPEGRRKFRQKFIEILEEKYSYKNKKNLAEDEEKCCFYHEDESGNNNQNKKLGLDYDDFKKKEMVSKHKYQSIIDDIDLEIKPEKEPSFYYYKRWIWIIFPWACMSIREDMNFSDVIGK